MSSSKAKTSTATTSNLTNIDRRLGVEGEGNLLATEGSSITINDTSPEIALAAIKANTDGVEDIVEFLNKSVASDRQLTEATRVGNANLAENVVDKATTAISDSRRDTNEKVLTDAFKYGAVAIVAGGGLIYLLSRKR